VEYLCGICNETYNSKCDYNPWWALQSHECPKCGKAQVPRLDISSPPNAIEYHPALLAHIIVEDNNNASGGNNNNNAAGKIGLASSSAAINNNNRISHNSTQHSAYQPSTASSIMQINKGGGPAGYNGDVIDFDDVSLSDSDDSEYEENMLPAARAENEDFGHDYSGPRYTDYDASRLLVLMNHASTCPGRHKDAKTRDVCQSTKLLMLHTRDCPGTTSLYDICPFPWCRKTKHLLYHLISCRESETCKICSPEIFPANLSALKGLNKHRRQRQEQRKTTTLASATVATASGVMSTKSSGMEALTKANTQTCQPITQIDIINHQNDIQQVNANLDALKNRPDTVEQEDIVMTQSGTSCSLTSQTGGNRQCLSVPSPFSMNTSVDSKQKYLEENGGHSNVALPLGNTSSLDGVKPTVNLPTQSITSNYSTQQIPISRAPSSLPVTIPSSGVRVKAATNSTHIPPTSTAPMVFTSNSHGITCDSVLVGTSTTGNLKSTMKTTLMNTLSGNSVPPESIIPTHAISPVVNNIVDLPADSTNVLTPQIIQTETDRVKANVVKVNNVTTPNALTWQLGNGQNTQSKSITSVQIVSGSDSSSSTSANSIGTGSGEHFTSLNESSCDDQKSSLPPPTEALQNSSRGGTCTISSDESVLGDHEANTSAEADVPCDANKIKAFGATPVNIMVKEEEVDDDREGNNPSDSHMLKNIDLEGFRTQSNDVNTKGRLPLHIATKCNLVWSAVSTILKENTAAVSVADPVTGLMPFMLAGVGKSSNLNTVYELLHNKPGIMHCQNDIFGTP